MFVSLTVAHRTSAQNATQQTVSNEGTQAETGSTDFGDAFYQDDFGGGFDSPNADGSPPALDSTAPAHAVSGALSPASKGKEPLRSTASAWKPSAQVNLPRSDTASFEVSADADQRSEDGKDAVSPMPLRRSVRLGTYTPSHIDNPSGPPSWLDKSSSGAGAIPSSEGLDDVEITGSELAISPQCTVGSSRDLLHHGGPTGGVPAPRDVTDPPSSPVEPAASTTSTCPAWILEANDGIDPFANLSPLSSAHTSRAATPEPALASTGSGAAQQEQKWRGLTGLRPRQMTKSVVQHKKKLEALLGPGILVSVFSAPCPFASAQYAVVDAFSISYCFRREI